MKNISKLRKFLIEKIEKLLKCNIFDCKYEAKHKYRFTKVRSQRSDRGAVSLATYRSNILGTLNLYLTVNLAYYLTSSVTKKRGLKPPLLRG